MKVLILYFSGTGNTRYVARNLQHALIQRDVTVEIHSIEENFSPSSFAYDLLIIGFPKYYENPVLFVLDYLKQNLPKRETKIPTMAFCTQAGPLPTDFSGLETLLKRKNHQLTVTKSFPFANNMMIFRSFQPTEPLTVEANKQKLGVELDCLLDTFLSHSESKETVKKWEGPLYHFIAVVCTKLMPVFGMRYSVSKECTSCGLCAKKCPRKNIEIVDGRPKFGKTCIFCMRCINACPTNAILYNNKKCPQYLCRN